MIDIIGILTSGWLKCAACIPLAGTPTAGSAATPPATQPAQPAQPANASSVVNEVQKFYASIKQVTAKFRQSVTNKTFGTSKDSDGTVWLKKPGKMRWDYLGKKGGQVERKKSFISNGTTLYVIEHDNKQIVKKNLANDLMPVAVTFLYGKGDLNKDFNAALDTKSTYGGKDDYVLKLTPKQPSAQYKTLYLVVNKTDYHVSQSVIIDSSDNTNQFRFYEPDFTKSVEDGWFEFNEASLKNYRVIDADQQGKDGATPSPMPPGTAPMPPADIKTDGKIDGKTAPAPAPAPAKK